MSAQSDIGFILRQHPYRESSLLLRVFCKQKGLISIIARGARRQNKNNLRGVLQLFSLLAWQFSGGDLKVLHQVESASDAPLQPLQLSEQKRFACASYTNELLLRTLHEGEQHESLFRQYALCLQNLSSANDNQQMALFLRQFEWSLLKDLGVAFDLSHTSDGQVVKPDLLYLVSAGGRVELSKETKQGISGATLLALQEERFASVNLKEAKRLMQILLAPQLGDKPLQSRKLWHYMSALDLNR